MDADEASLFRRHLMALHRRMREEHIGDVPLNEVLVLGAVDRHGVSARPSVVADDLRMARSNLAALLRRLEAREFIKMTPDAADGRRSVIRLTHKGRKHLERDRSERELWLVKAVTKELTPSEAKQLLAAGALMQRVANFHE
ncbi:MarR family winged helix-turn-helix transcriptional regulator [Streptomyces kronopolitis]|uniref:MarR family winged helix-turn-helix transcriptional regulator n=1 Tax=Streptomyces kronopolitis TaxID=1612435 RepID=UPI003696D796